MTPRSPTYAEAQRSIPTGRRFRPTGALPTPAWASSTKRSPTAIAAGETPNQIYTLTSRANAYLGKGNLDAALGDYEQVLKINPNYVRAYVGRGQLFEKRRNLAAARADYRAAANAVAARREDIDTTLARAIAKERLEACWARRAAPQARLRRRRRNRRGRARSR
jgi:tetratricopeptide (TPR) repeat protein